MSAAGGLTCWTLSELMQRAHSIHRLGTNLVDADGMTASVFQGSTRVVTYNKAIVQRHTEQQLLCRGH